MNIVCPQCGFSRDVNPERFKNGPVVATCPHCSCRFRISQNGEVGTILPPKGWKVMEGRPESVEEEEEEIRQAAKEAYEKEANRFRENATQSGANKIVREPAESNPWMMAPENGGWLYAFSQTIIKVMFSMAAFSRGLKADARLVRPLVFYLLLGIYQTLIERMWVLGFQSLLATEAAGDPQLEKMLGMLSSDTGLLLSVLLRSGILVLQIYVFSFLMYLVYRLFVPGIAKFGIVFQIIAYSAAPYILCAVPILGSITALFWGLGCIATGCRSAMNLTWPQTIAGFAPILIVFAPLFPEIMKMIA